MRVPCSEVRIEFLATVRDIVAVGVLQKPDVGGAGCDHAILVEHEASDQLQLVGENLLGIHDAVSVFVAKYRNAVGRVAIVLAREKRPRVHPAELAVRLPEAVRIFGRLAYPQPPHLVPI